MNRGLRTALLIAALALAYGVVQGAVIRDVPRSLTFLGLALTVLILERIVAVWGRGE